MKQLDCEEVARRLHSFLDRELDEGEIAEVQAHLDECEECHSKFRFEASFKRLLATHSSDQAASPSLRERLSNRLREMK